MINRRRILSIPFAVVMIFLTFIFISLFMHEAPPQRSKMTEVQRHFFRQRVFGCSGSQNGSDIRPACQLPPEHRRSRVPTPAAGTGRRQPDSRCRTNFIFRKYCIHGRGTNYGYVPNLYPFTRTEAPLPPRLLPTMLLPIFVPVSHPELTHLKIFRRLPRTATHRSAVGDTRLYSGLRQNRRLCAVLPLTLPHVMVLTPDADGRRCKTLDADLIYVERSDISGTFISEIPFDLNS